MNLLILAGFAASQPVQAALITGGAAATLSGALGVFTVLRGQAFAGHALADVSSAGGALALLLGVSPMLGFFALGLLGALGLSVNRDKQDDLAAGILLGAGLGCTALILHFAVIMRGVAGAASRVMFGALFAVPSDQAWAALGGAVVGLTVLGFFARPLLLASMNADLARVQGIPVRVLGGAYLVLLALSVTLSAMAVGAILSTALLIGPAAAALRLARRPFAAMVLASGLGVACCWAGVALAYASYDWTAGRVWPVSFFITFCVLLVYAASSWRRA